MASINRQIISATAQSDIDIKGTTLDDPHVFITRTFLDANGDPVTPTGGTYSIQIKLLGMPNFETIPSGTGIAASDASPNTLSFAGNAETLRYIPSSIVGAVNVQITVIGNKA